MARCLPLLRGVMAIRDSILHSYAKRYETLLSDPVFRKYPDFKEMLDYFASESCKGCRNEQCKVFKDCGVHGCHQKTD
jgi:hypothetical protein